jgi:hypothetical protein
MSTREAAVNIRESQYVRFTKHLLFGAFHFRNSPLTNMLSNYFGEKPDLCARTTLHLYDLLEGDAERAHRRRRGVGACRHMGIWAYGRIGVFRPAGGEDLVITLNRYSESLVTEE